MEFKRLPSPPPTNPATREEVFEFLSGLQRFRRKGDRPFNEKAIADYINKQPLGSLQGISRRIMMDILKSPTADPKSGAPPKGKGKKEQAAPKHGAAKKKKAASRKPTSKKKTSRKK